MVGGTPEIKAPFCYDPTQTWRPAANHRASQVSGTPLSRVSTPSTTPETAPPGG